MKETDVVSRAWVTPKAIAQWRELTKNFAPPRVLADALAGVTVYRMSEDSVYWIHVDGEVRFVLMRERGSADVLRRFVLVTVKENRPCGKTTIT